MVEMSKSEKILEVCRTETTIAREIYKLEKLTNGKVMNFQLLNRDFTLSNGKEVSGLKPVLCLKW